MDPSGWTSHNTYPWWFFDFVKRLGYLVSEFFSQGLTVLMKEPAKNGWWLSVIDSLIRLFEKPFRFQQLTNPNWSYYYFEMPVKGPNQVSLILGSEPGLWFWELCVKDYNIYTCQLLPVQFQARLSAKAGSSQHLYIVHSSTHNKPNRKKTFFVEVNSLNTWRGVYVGKKEIRQGQFFNRMERWWVGPSLPFHSCSNFGLETS